jgi:hypothetical protein
MGGFVGQMRLTRTNLRTASAGATVVVIGLFAMWEAVQYPFGTARMIGPAVFPFGISLLMICSGLAILADDLRPKAGGEDEELPPAAIPVRNLLAILGSMAAFGFLLQRFGLIPAVFAGVLIASLADRTLRPQTALLLAIALSVGCSLIFVTLLKLPISPFVM